MDFRLTSIVTADNPVIGDIAQGPTGDFGTVEGIDEIVQLIRSALEFQRGEWFLDIREGVPWLQEVLRKGGTQARRRALIRQVLLSVPGVLSVESLTSSFNRTLRTMSATFVVKVEGGRLLRSSDYSQPFIVGNFNTSREVS